MTADVTRLSVARNRVAEPALRRYKALRDRGKPDAEARNIAAVQTAAELKFVFSTQTVRRELDRLLDPAPGPRWGGRNPWGI